MFPIRKQTGIIPVSDHPILFWGILILILAFGIGALVYATPYGPGLINDSVVYIGGAENILAGHGYSRTSGGGEIKPLTVNAPIYAYVLAGVARSGVDLIHAGWLVSLACFALNGLLAALLGLRLTHSHGWSLFAAILFICSETALRAHSFALSEPLFITFMLAAMLLLTYAVERQVWFFPAAAGLLVSLTYLTRYIGFSILGTGMLVLFVFSDNWKVRLIKLGWFLLFSLLGGMIWMSRNLLVSGNPANRTLLFHPLTLDKVQEGTQTLMAFLLPNRLNLYPAAPQLWDGLTIFGIFACIGLIFWLWRKGRNPLDKEAGEQTRTAMLTALQAVLYLVVLFLSLTFFDASTALENRILVPIFICLILLYVYLLHQLWRQPKIWLSRMALALALITILTTAYDGRRTVLDLHADGQGYASAYYRNSQTIDALKRMPPEIIWTNRVPAVNLLADRPAYALLAPIDPLTRQKRPNYDSSLQAIRQSVLVGKAVLVIFEARQVLEDPIEGLWVKDLIQNIPAVFESDDGIIYAAK
ncbi:MAG TPA: hypothetical protein VF338_01420 [Leptolinea sp.]